MLKQQDNAEWGKRIRQRWRKNTLREVYFGSDGRVTKRFWIRPGARRYPKPWVCEHAALERLKGDGFPRSYGIRERPFERGQEILFVRDFMEGRPLDCVSVEDARKIGVLLARMHRAGVVMNDAAMDNFVKDDDDRIQCIDFGCARVFRWCTPCLFYVAGKELNKLYRKTFAEDPACWYAFVQTYFRERNAKLPARWVTWLGYGVSRATRWWRKDLMGARRRMRRYERRYGIPKCREKAFERGAMMVQPTLDYRGALETYISNLDFLDLPESARLETHNKRYRVYSFFLPAAQRDVILKVSWANPAYGFWRRLNVQILQHFKNYAKVAFLGALALDRVGIRTITPLACWRYRTGTFNVESYFLYEKLPAVGSVLSIANEARENPSSETQAALNNVIDEMADTVRCLHEQAFRHGDIAIGNFLVDIINPRPVSASAKPGYRVAIIDTDHVMLSRLRFGVVKRFFDLRDLRRLNFDEAGRRRFMKRYLGGDFDERWWRVHLFWRRWGRHPLRLLFQILIGKRTLWKG